jgi:hypothetical protein
VHRLPIDNLAIGQTQLGNEVSGTDNCLQAARLAL